MTNTGNGQNRLAPLSCQPVLSDGAAGRFLPDRLGIGVPAVGNRSTSRRESEYRPSGIGFPTGWEYGSSAVPAKMGKPNRKLAYTLYKIREHILYYAANQLPLQRFNPD